MGTTPTNLRRSLEDLATDLAQARRQADLGKLALLCYCEVRPWARMAGEPELAELSSDFFTQRVPPDRESFLRQVDELVAEVGRVRMRLNTSLPRAA